VTPANTCLDAETLAAWVDGGLNPTEAAKAEAHVSSCDRCQETLGLIVKTTPVLAARTPWWRQLRAGWLVPLTAGVAGVGFWMIASNRSAVVQPTAPPAAAVTQLSEANSIAKSQSPPAPAQEDRLAAKDDADTRARDRGARPEPKQQKLEFGASRERRGDERLADSARNQAAPAAVPPPAPPAVALGRMEAQAPAREAVAQPAAARETTSPDGSIRWRIADAGGLEKSTNAGTSWDAVQTGISGELASVRATDARTVIVTTVDGRTFQTTDTGATWTRR
jgi:pyruvate/2-oxoglutarate dehydrogenase complex dihydrolipoamide acyltransferase (E2) component